MAVEVGQVLDGKYRIIRLIGKGGMGAVYEATHLLIDRRVAVKELLASAAAADHAITRFEREARAAGRIGSDHILQIFDVGVLPDGSRYMVSEFLDGETLDSRLRRVGRLSPAELLHVAQQLLTGLGAAHQARVLHRDLKPDNIFLVRQKTGVADFVKIIDFGIAKFQLGANAEDALKMTKTGMVVGTPYYLSPEQARGSGEGDARSDLYAVGIILYECITGTVPFSAQSFNELIFKIVLEKPQPPAERIPGIDQRLSDLILKAMARDPAARFQSAEEMMTALSAWASAYDFAASPRVLTPLGVQTLASDQPFSFFPSGGAAQSDGSLRTLASPTPASFGATHDPRFSTPDLPFYSRLPLVVLGFGGALLLLVVVGFVVFRNLQGSGPSATGSVALPPTSSAQPTVAPPEAVAPAPGEVASPEAAAPTPPPFTEPPEASESSLPRVQSPKLSPAQRTPSPKQVAPAPAPAPPPPPPPVVEAPAVPNQAAPADPKSKRPKGGDWGY
ncbi:MAG TPA: serine/threonine-protein kinase [Polyangiaceae bacterium]|nr:serine/threonine-protein kinase [Polyangiaceae bacterium]